MAYDVVAVSDDRGRRVPRVVGGGGVDRGGCGGAGRIIAMRHHQIFGAPVVVADDGVAVGTDGDRRVKPVRVVGGGVGGVYGVCMCLVCLYLFMCHVVLLCIM